jgi:hypothetical protein
MEGTTSLTVVAGDVAGPDPEVATGFGGDEGFAGAEAADETGVVAVGIELDVGLVDAAAVEW